MRALAAIALLGTLVVPDSARAETTLTLTEVLRSVAATHPTLASARASVSEQRGRVLASESAFEPTLSGGGWAVPVGYYEYWQLAMSIEQTIPGTAARLKGGYRMGRGDFPDYYGERATRDGGELYVQAELPLLADRAIDKQRAAIRKARLEVTREQARLAQSWLEVGRDASLRYWEWLAAGQRLRVAQELGAIAEERAKQIGDEVASGARPQVDKTDAQRVLLARQSAIVKARAEFASAVQKLSLYYRDNHARPVMAGLERVQVAMAEPPSVVESNVQGWIDEAIRNRPELDMLEQERESAQIDREQANNLGLPRIDLTGFVARDLGAGPEPLGQTDVGAGISISMPLFRREGRGSRRSAEAKLAALSAKRRGLRDRIESDIRQNAQLAVAAEQRALLASERLLATQSLAEAERERLRQGASNILMVNLRELDIASAAVEVIDAKLDWHRAVLGLRFARGVRP